MAGDYVETFHQLLLATETKSRLRTRVNLGTEAHRRRLGRSSCIIMLKNLGYTIISVQIPDHVLAAVQNMDEIEIYVLFFCLSTLFPP